MQAKTTIAQRIREAFRWQSLKHLLLFNTVIAVVLTVADFPQSLKFLWTSLVAHLIYSMAIGFGIYFLSFSLDLDRLNRRWKFILGMICTFILGGWIGAVTASYIAASLLGIGSPITHISPFIINVAMLSLVFGFIGFAYFHLQERLHTAAASLAEAEVNEQKLHQLKLEAELDALRAKVQPHFLFNALNSIASLIQSEPHLAEELVQKLSNLLRSTMRSGETEWVTLAQELELVHAYLGIEKARLGSRLTFEVNLPIELETARLPVLLLQPLVENSVKHGIAPKRQGGHLAVHCQRHQDRCHVEIRDNGRGWPVDDYREGFGLGAVRDRLSLHFGNDYGLEITNDQGVRLNLEWPLRLQTEAG